MYYDMAEAGGRIKKLRQRLNLTQGRLSEELNISLDHLKKIESGSRGGSIDMMVAFSEFFHVSLDYLILGKEPDVLPSRQEVQQVIDQLSVFKKYLK